MQTVIESCRLSESLGDCQRVVQTVIESGRLSECRAHCQRAWETVRQSGRLSDSQADCQRMPTHTNPHTLPTHFNSPHILYPPTSPTPTPLHPHILFTPTLASLHPHTLLRACVYVDVHVCVCVCVHVCVCVSMIPTYLLSQLPGLFVCVYMLDGWVRVTVGVRGWLWVGVNTHPH